MCNVNPPLFQPRTVVHTPRLGPPEGMTPRRWACGGPCGTAEAQSPAAVPRSKSRLQGRSPDHRCGLLIRSSGVCVRPSPHFSRRAVTAPISAGDQLVPLHPE